MQRGEELEARERDQPQAHHQQQVLVPARDHPVDDQPREQRHRQREELEHQRDDDDALEHVRLLEHLQRVPAAELPLGFLPVSKFSPGSSSRATPVKDWRKRSSDTLPPALARIDQVDAVAAQPLEDHEVRELPVQDRARRQVLQRLLVDRDAAAAQPEGARRAQDVERRHAVARRPHRLPHLLQPHGLAVVAQHHGQARRAALDLRELAHHGDPALAPCHAQVARSAGKRSSQPRMPIASAPHVPMLPSVLASSVTRMRSVRTRASARASIPSK